MKTKSKNFKEEIDVSDLVGSTIDIGGVEVDVVEDRGDTVVYINDEGLEVEVSKADIEEVVEEEEETVIEISEPVLVTSAAGEKILLEPTDRVVVMPEARFKAYQKSLRK